jgi:release factor glutamine methyltransferase
VDKPLAGSQTTITTALAEARERLTGLTDTPGLDARVLLANICKREKSWLLAYPETRLTENQIQEFHDKLDELASGTPLPYILGEWEFFGLAFKVNAEVLIPRPETELLVETALEWLRRNPARKRAAEAGTGSGCIAISLAVHQPGLELTATELSPAALEVAVENARRHEVEERIVFRENDLLGNMSGEFDLICANLPYIPTETLQTLAVYQREPTLALDGGEDGLDLIRRLLAQATNLLADDGLILLEIEDRQGSEAKDIAREKFPGSRVEVKLDLAGKARLLVIER